MRAHQLAGQVDAVVEVARPDDGVVPEHMRARRVAQQPLHQLVVLRVALRHVLVVRREVRPHEAELLPAHAHTRCHRSLVAAGAHQAAAQRVAPHRLHLLLYPPPHRHRQHHAHHLPAHHPAAQSPSHPSPRASRGKLPVSRCACLRGHGRSVGGGLRSGRCRIPGRTPQTGCLGPWSHRHGRWCSQGTR